MSQLEPQNPPEQNPPQLIQPHQPTPEQIRRLEDTLPSFFIRTDRNTVYYLSGPMTGIKDYNFPAFDRMAEFFTKLGYTVYNPADTSRALGMDKTWVDYIKADLDGMVELQKKHGSNVTLFQLPGWGNSLGATIEYMIALSWGWNVETFRKYDKTELPNIEGEPLDA